jgi:NADP-reducing hydrogenase subunit HndB
MLETALRGTDDRAFRVRSICELTSIALIHDIRRLQPGLHVIEFTKCRFDAISESYFLSGIITGIRSLNMASIKSLDDLKRLKAETLQKRQAQATAGQARIVVAMGTCGIAAGARAALKAILDTIEADQLPGIVVSQTGCIGQCEWEPIIRVTVGAQSEVIYGKVSPDKARQIVTEHVVGGQVVKGSVLPA